MRFDYSDIKELKTRMNESIRRFNALAANFDILSEKAENQINSVNTFKTAIHVESVFVNESIVKLHELCDKSQKINKDLKSQFKLILKKEQYDKLQRRIDLLDYENMMPKHEFERLLFSHF